MSAARPVLAVWKFASCDGCQLSLLSLDEHLAALVERFEIAHFLEASSRTLEGPVDLSLVEGSITTPEGAERIRAIRARSRRLVTIGACATHGGIQALRNLADHRELQAHVYPSPSFLSSLDRSTAIADHVPVDYELLGCPVRREQLLEVITATLAGRAPQVPAHPVCFECKAAGAPCVPVTRGIPCLGPVTHAGCGAVCPRFGRGCFGCHGPLAGARPDALGASWTLLTVDGRPVPPRFEGASAFGDALRAGREDAS